MRLEGIDKDFPDNALVIFKPDKTVKEVRNAQGHTLWAWDIAQGRAVADQEKQTAAILPRPMSVGVSLPTQLQKAILFTLNSAAYEAVAQKNEEIRAYWQAYLTGMQSILGMLCSGLNYDLSFIEEQEHDHKGVSISATKGGPAAIQAGAGADRQKAAQ